MPEKRAGGVRQFAESLLGDLMAAGFRVVVLSLDAEESDDFGAGITIVRNPSSNHTGWRRFAAYLCLAAGWRTRQSQKREELLEATHSDVALFPTPIACPPPGNVPFIVVIPDLMHRYYPGLPEYRWPKRLARDVVYRRYARNAAAVIVDAEAGADDAVRFLGVLRQKCSVLPFQVPPAIYRHRGMSVPEAASIIEKFGLPKRYLFYPAQFWAHKNHSLLLQAIAALKRERNFDVHLVCAGWADGSFRRQSERILALARSLGVAGQLHLVGYVCPLEIAALYRCSRALIFPSLLGPTNIPPLEAMLMGIPVLCSNLFGMPQQMGEAGLLFDPFSVDDAKNVIARIWVDDRLAAELSERGRKRSSELEKFDRVATLRTLISKSLLSK